MVYFQTKNSYFGKFGRDLQWKMLFTLWNYDHLVYCTAVWYILWPFGIFCGHLVYLWPFGIFCGLLVYIFCGHLVYFGAIWYSLWPFGIVCGYLVYFMIIWYIFSVLVRCNKKNLATLYETILGFRQNFRLLWPWLRNELAWAKSVLRHRNLRTRRRMY
jgi:hypothetical protein